MSCLIMVPFPGVDSVASSTPHSMNHELRYRLFSRLEIFSLQRWTRWNKDSRLNMNTSKFDVNISPHSERKSAWNERNMNYRSRPDRGHEHVHFVQMFIVWMKFTCHPDHRASRMHVAYQFRLTVWLCWTCSLRWAVWSSTHVLKHVKLLQQQPHDNLSEDFFRSGSCTDWWVMM